MNSSEMSSYAFSDPDFIILVGENFSNKQFIDCPLHIFPSEVLRMPSRCQTHDSKAEIQPGNKDILSCSTESDIQESRPHVYP